MGSIILFLCMLVWIIIGVVIALCLCYSLDPVITHRDVLVSCVCGIFGPFMLIYYVMYSGEHSWLDEPLNRK